MENWPIFGKVLGRKKEGKEGKLEMVCAYDTKASERHPRRNGDSFLVDIKAKIAGLFDGMSTPYGDQLASQACVEYVKSKIGEVKDGMSAEKAMSIIEDILEGADSFVAEPERYKEYREVYQSIGGDMDKKPGTTATFLKIHTDAERKNWAIVGHVGNSRLYRIEEDGKLTQLTEDDDMLEIYYGDEKQRALVSRKFSNLRKEEGLADEKERLAFRKKHLLTKAIGCGITKGTTLAIEVKAGDRFLLLTDGILNLTTSDMEDILKSSKNPEKIIKKLIEGATKISRKGKKENIRSSPDDMTAILVEVK